MFTTIFLVTSLVALVVIFVALHRIRPKSFRLRARAFRWFTVELDMRLPDDPPPRRPGR